MLLALAAAAAAALVVAVVALGGGEPRLNADPIDPPRPAPATAGRDSTGGRVAVPIAGRPALVTFLFTDCPDVCPLTAQEISAALDRVGPDVAGAIDVVAVSVDPRGDTPAAVRAFLQRHRLTGRMRYIVGSRAELSPLWSRWHVAAQQGPATASAHSARIVLVDRDGRQVGSYAAALPIDIDGLAADIRALTG
jgi:protein SCO1/2